MNHRSNGHIIARWTAKESNNPDNNGALVVHCCSGAFLSRLCSFDDCHSELSAAAHDETKNACYDVSRCSYLFLSNNNNNYKKNEYFGNKHQCLGVYQYS